MIGAVIDPKHCLNLLEASALEQVRFAYEVLAMVNEGPLPSNRGGEDLRARYLDCAVIETLHNVLSARNRERQGEGGGYLAEYDTVRGAFWEGAALYPGAGFKAKSHVQICVRNLDCIKGYFRVLPEA